MRHFPPLCGGKERCGLSRRHRFGAIDHALDVLAARVEILGDGLVGLLQRLHVGLWGPIITKGYEEMGIIGYAQTDVQALQEADETIAKDFDARRKYVESVVDRAKAVASAKSLCASLPPLGGASRSDAGGLRPTVSGGGPLPLASRKTASPRGGREGRERR